MTRLCVPITASTWDAMLRDVQAAMQAGASLIELRLDYLDPGQQTQIETRLPAMIALGTPLIVTCRSASEGGRFAGDEIERARIYEAALRAGVDGIDVELAAWTISRPLRERLWAALDATAGQPRRLFDDGAAHILSVHDFELTPQRLGPILAEMLNTPADIIKIAFKANSIVDAIRVLESLYQWRNALPTIAIAMGEPGILTRVLAKKFDAFLTFASLVAGKESAPGQMTIEQMKSLYRWDALDENTLLYGVVGCPVAHSMSPTLHNAAFEATGHNGVYLPMRVEPSWEDFKAFLDAVLERAWMDLRGLSVTIPHKEHLLRYVREHIACHGPDSGHIEPLADRIGVANTLVITRHETEPHRASEDASRARSASEGFAREPAGAHRASEDANRARSASEGFAREASSHASPTRADNPAPVPAQSGSPQPASTPHSAFRIPHLSVYNTDYAGALEALSSSMNITLEDLHEMRIAVLGAGGAARAIVAGLRDAGATVYIYNRTNSRARALAAEFGAVAMPWESRSQMMCEIIINCTSVGMWPDTDETPLEKENIPPNSIIFDTVNNPIETRFMREARARNALVIGGNAMFVAQAARQFKLWTGIDPPTDLMRDVVFRRLSGKT